MQEKDQDGRFVERRQYNVKRLWEKHHEMLRQVTLGRTNVEIAESIGCTPQTVSNVRNSPLAREVLDQRMQQLDEQTYDMTERLKEFAPVAMRLLEEVIEGRHGASIALRARYADKHLGRVGYGEIKKIASMHEHLTREDIEAIKLRAVQAAERAGAVVEAEFSAAAD